MKPYTYIVGLLILFNLSACRQEHRLQTEEDFYAWINEPENGLMQERYINNIHLEIKYLPNELLILQEWQQHNRDTILLDSLKEQYQHAKTFVLTIGPDERDGKKAEDILFKGIGTYEEYREKLLSLSFGIEAFVSLKVDDIELKPVLSHLENVYGLVNSRKINIVFVPQSAEQESLLNSKDLDFTFNDEFFRTGIHHFIFRQDAINKIPKIKFTQHDAE